MTYPSFSAGEVLRAQDMNAVGMWLVKSQTIGAGVSTVPVTGAFSADYDVYLITVSGGVASTNLGINLTLGATITGYYSSGFNQAITASTINATNTNNGTSWTSVAYGSTNALSGQITLDNPFAAKRTMVSYQARATSNNYFVNQQHGFLDDNTSYTAFTLTVAGGNITGGTIRVYGLRN